MSEIKPIIVKNPNIEEVMSIVSKWRNKYKDLLINLKNVSINNKYLLVDIDKESIRMIGLGKSVFSDNCEVFDNLDDFSNMYLRK